MRISDMDAEADEVINELNPLTEGEDVIMAQDKGSISEVDVAGDDLYGGE